MTDLRERVAAAMRVVAEYDEDQVAAVFEQGDFADHSAQLALAALGLDNWEAAVERGKDWLHESPYNPCNAGSDTCDARRAVRGVLEAVLTAQEAEND